MGAIIQQFARNRIEPSARRREDGGKLLVCGHCGKSTTTFGNAGALLEMDLNHSERSPLLIVRMRMIAPVHAWGRYGLTPKILSIKSTSTKTKSTEMDLIRHGGHPLDPALLE